MIINQATVDLVKEFEGFRPEAYKCPAGRWTIGYGTTTEAGLGVVVRPGMVISRAQGEEYLIRGLEKFAAQIEPYFTAEPNENEFGAFLSLAYNIGPGAFKRSSALRKFNEGDKEGARKAIALWNKATVNGVRKVLPGLVRRRAREMELFATPVPHEIPKLAKPDLGEPTGWAKFLEWLTGWLAGKGKQ